MKIGFYLSIHGIRRVAALQVIVLVHAKLSILRGLAGTHAIHAMLRSDSMSHAR
jgi:hypothetical protein